MKRTIRIVIFAAALVALTGCEARIQQGLDERQANEIVTALLERGFQPKKELEPGKKPTWSITVDSDQSDDATRTLVELGLPREKQPTAADVIKPGIIPSATEEFQLKMIGLQGDIARTLESVDGVITARVHLVVSPPPRPGQPQLASKAAAFMRVRAGKGAWMQANREQLRQLIAGSVEGLSAENVTLVVNEVQSTVPPPVHGFSSGIETRLRIGLVIIAAMLSIVSAAFVFFVIRFRASKPRPAPPAPAAQAAASAPQSRKAA